MKKKIEVNWQLFRRAAENKLTKEEQVIFNRWLQSEKSHQEYFQKAIKYYSKEIKYSAYERLELDVSYYDFIRYTRRKRLMMRRVASIAASLALLISLLFAFSHFHNEQKDITAGLQLPIEPGKSIAHLTLHTGAVINLADKSDTLISLAEAGSVLVIDSSGLMYSDKEQKNSKNSVNLKNSLTTPRGGEYRLTLSDGTIIWLNAESRLDYPVNFCSGKREITLSGEAYIKVAQLDEMPFVVHTAFYDIEVKGTSFNISAYSDDPFQILTLETGKVEVSFLENTYNQSLTLGSDQQFIFNATTNETELKRVDASKYIAWTSGYFIFDEEPLSLIMEKMVRWYDLNVIFLNSNSANEVFTGKLPCFEKFEVIVEMIEKVGDADFQLEGKNITIK